MKKILGFVGILVLGWANFAFGKPIDSDVAKKVATSHLYAEEQFFKKNPHLAPKVFTKGQGFSILESQALKKTKGVPLAYIFDLAPEGYVAISSDTDIRPVIAYSFKGKFPIEESVENILLHLLTQDMENRVKALPITSQKLKQENNALLMMIVAP